MYVHVHIAERGWRRQGEGQGYLSALSSVTHGKKQRSRCFKAPGSSRAGTQLVGQRSTGGTPSGSSQNSSLSFSAQNKHQSKLKAPPSPACRVLCRGRLCSRRRVSQGSRKIQKTKLLCSPRAICPRMERGTLTQVRTGHFPTQSYLISLGTRSPRI